MIGSLPAQSLLSLYSPRGKEAITATILPDTNNLTGQRTDVEQVKDKLRKHPMLPLLSQLLERCGETTTSAQELSKLANEDVNLFFQQICTSAKSCFSGDEETDTLVRLDSISPPSFDRAVLLSTAGHLSANTI